MENQLVDRLTIENLIPTTNTESLAKGYILTCKSEGKSPNTIAIYEIVIKNFIWYCKQNDFPEAQQLTSIHIRHFLWYLSSGIYLAKLTVGEIIIPLQGNLLVKLR